MGKFTKSGYTACAKQHYCVSVKVRTCNGEIYRQTEKAVEMILYTFESPLIENIIQSKKSQFTMIVDIGGNVLS